LDAKKKAEKAAVVKKEAEAMKKAEEAKKLKAQQEAASKAELALKKAAEDTKAAISNSVVQMLQKEQPISHEIALLGHHTQINQNLDASIEEKLKIEIKKDEEEA
jgi:hypothetical protein